MKHVIVVLCMALAYTNSYSQGLDAYAGIAAGYDGFFPDKQITPHPLSGRPLLSPQFVAGMRYQSQQNFNLMLDATLGISRFSMPIPAKAREYYYEQIRSLITIGSGLYIPLQNEQHVLPFIQLGTAFYDFESMTEKTQKGYVGMSTDYNTKHWVPVCGGGIEYGFRFGIPSAIGLRFLYTPLDIFPEPVRYDISGINKTGAYALQGKLLQFILSYQVMLPIFKNNPDM